MRHRLTDRSGMAPMVGGLLTHAEAVASETHRPPDAVEHNSVLLHLL